MTVINAIILGLIQGIAEFLPISSSGHLSVICNLFDLAGTGDENVFFDALLHLGTLFSICIVFWKDIVEMFNEVVSFAGFGPYGQHRKEQNPAARMFIMLVMATLPLFLILPVNDYFDSLFGQNLFIGVMFILTGCILFISDKFIEGRKTEKNMSILDALIIGLCQCVAAIPGISRSGVTITAGIATGLKKEYAVKFSFLLSIPAVLGANLISLIHTFKTGVALSNIPAYMIGLVVSLVTGIFTLTIFKKLSVNLKLGGFAYYCWIVGALSIILTIIF